MHAHRIALAPFLRDCPSVITLPPQATFDEYSNEQKRLLIHAPRVFFPGPRFATLLQAVDKPTFPGPFSYRYQRSRVLQMLLFKVLSWPCPRTRIYFGTRQKQEILQHFRFPLLAMGPRVSVGTAQILQTNKALEAFAAQTNPLIIQESVHWQKRVRILCVRYQCLGVHLQTEASVQFHPIDMERDDVREIVDAARQLARAAHLDDMVIEWGYGNGAWQVIAMQRPPVRWPTPEGVLNRHQHVCALIQSGRL